MKEVPGCLKDEHLAHLDRLRDSGITNMWGAAPFLRCAFRTLTDAEAGAISRYWRATFELRGEEMRDTKKYTVPLTRAEVENLAIGRWMHSHKLSLGFSLIGIVALSVVLLWFVKDAVTSVRVVGMVLPLIAYGFFARLLLRALRKAEKRLLESSTVLQDADEVQD